MGEIIQYIVVHWVEWLFVAISTFLGLCYRQMAKRQKEESRKNAALHDGMQALLREPYHTGLQSLSGQGLLPYIWQRKC